MEPQYIVACVIAALFVGFIAGAASATSKNLPMTNMDGIPLPGGHPDFQDLPEPETGELVTVEWLPNKDRKGRADEAYIWIRNIKHPHHPGLVNLALTEEDWASLNDRADKNPEDVPEPPQDVPKIKLSDLGI